MAGRDGATSIWERGTGAAPTDGMGGGQRSSEGGQGAGSARPRGGGLDRRRKPALGEPPQQPHSAPSTRLPTCKFGRYTHACGSSRCTPQEPCSQYTPCLHSRHYPYPGKPSTSPSARPWSRASRCGCLSRCRRPWPGRSTPTAASAAAAASTGPAAGAAGAPEARRQAPARGPAAFPTGPTTSAYVVLPVCLLGWNVNVRTLPSPVHPMLPAF